MARLAILLPNEEMFRQTHDVLQELRLRADIIKIIDTKSSVSEAREAIAQGAEIIIARGLQASIIKRHTDIPVVEISITRQGMRAMLERAKRLLNKECPTIALVMFRNMICEAQDIAEELGIKIREYYVQNPELLRDAAVQAVEDGAELIIGGATALEISDAAGIPSLFLTNTSDAVAAAVREAVQLSGSLERSLKTEKKHIESFVNFPYKSRSMESLIRLAENLSGADCPKLLVEPVGTIHSALARAIHNSSSHSGDKLLCYDCVEGETAYEVLFGRQGMLTHSGRGSLQINDIEYLDRRSQRKLLELMLFRHVIAVTRKTELKKYLIPELYERLHPFRLVIPALSECREDVELLISEYTRKLTEKHGRYHVLSAEAKSFLSMQEWRGNRIQLESFLERLILCAGHRSISRREAESLYTSLYSHEACPEERETFGGGTLEGAGLNAEGAISSAFTESFSEKAELARALRESFGNRERTAERLGISTTTLWRKLKKHGML